jgi:phosphohistidine phosphatase SixA
MKYFLTLLLILVSFCFQELAISSLSKTDHLWRALKSGNHLVLMRHALAPGFSDPKNFDIDECSTQRNLNKDGRSQARSIGDQFRENGIINPLVYSSQWCRCIETAELLEFGAVEELVILNSFFKNFERKQIQTNSSLEWILKSSLATPTVLVTHQVNITALTGFTPSSGELVFVKRELEGKLSIIGTLKTSLDTKHP